MKEAPISEARWKAIWDAFHEVLEGPAAERDALLERACGGDAALRREVEELLAADEKGLPVLDELSLNIAPTVSSDGPQPRLGDVRLEPGRVLAGRFQIVGRVGAGGMGEVYEARDRELGRRVAVKTLLADKARSAAALARFRKEIHLAQQVTHRNVCRVFDLFRDGDLVFLTMELLEGETLAARLQREGRLGLPETKLILEQVAAALEAAHEVGVIHRDLKPANVLLVEESTGPRAVVTDFGLATSGMAGPEEAHLTRTGEVLGTPAYMAPEQLEGRETGPATDVYALGLLLYEMVTGKRPFEGSSTFSIASRRLGGPAPSPRNHVPDLDERWERVILRCLERDPANRFQHPREVVEPLREDSAPLPASGIVPWRRRWMARTAAIAALAILVIAFFWWKGLLPGFPGKGEAGKSTASNSAPNSTKRETVLVADFDNRTGDQSLDGAGTALARELESSHLLTVAADGRIADSLRLMRRPADSRLDASLARQVALRDGGIQSVLTGKIVRSNEDLALTVSLIAADSGAVVKSWTRKAGPSSAAVQAALRQVGLEVRRYLGENPRQIQESGERLARVTTPSLAALRLYDQAEAAIEGGRPDTAEQLIRGAIRLDPDFASAYIILAYTLHNQRRPAREFMPPAERAMDLAGNATQREAYFIRASYYAFTGDREKMFAAYDALLRLYPDHYWANNNMANLLPQAAAVPYAVRCAQLRPRNAARSFRAAMDLINGANKPDEAEPYVERVVALTADSSFDPRAGGEIAWARLWQAHRDWTAGKLDEAKAELDRWAAKLPGMREGEDYWMRQYLIRGYRTLGMARRAMELAPPTEFPITRKFYQGLDAYFVGDADRARRNFTADSWQIQDTADLWRDPLRVAALARLGWTDKAGAILASFRKRPSEDPMRRRPSLVEARMEAEMPLAAGRFREAALLLEAKAFGPRISVGERGFEGYGSSYFLAAQALSIAYRKLGRTEDAVAILKQALAERLRSYPNGTETWMDTQLRLARLDRELGKTAEAERLEAQLRGLMKFADPDFWALRRLKEQSGSPTASQSPP